MKYFPWEPDIAALNRAEHTKRLIVDARHAQISAEIWRNAVAEAIRSLGIARNAVWSAILATFFRLRFFLRSFLH